MKRVLALCALLLIFPISARACLWDNDTLETEAKGIPDTIAVITGRFPRNPDLYYQMRLARVAKELQSTPNKLELYDDAGVACDRLHRDDEAMAWMEKKRAVLARAVLARVASTRGASAQELHEHRYRYCANLGTFIAHRWLRSGANRKQISEMKRARDLIAQAIKLNPNAHFGREKYQLKAMEWIIHPPKSDDNRFELPNFLGDDFYESAPQAVKGLSGLIVLGDAWQSVDIFNALAKAIQLDKNRSSPAFLTRLRASEIAGAGGKSLLPNSPRGKALKTLLIGKGNMTHFIEEKNIPALEAEFKDLRNEADEWQATRTDYMMAKLKAGKHPDTDKVFWKDWKEKPAPSLHIVTLQERKTRLLNAVLVAIGVLATALAASRLMRRKKTAG